MPELIIERIPVSSVEDYAFHISRYEFASHFAASSIVLDAACGNGYGAKNLVNGGAHRVFGIDISNEAVYTANQNFGDTKVSFSQANIQSLPIGNNSVDLIVSFETIEHVADAICCVKEFRRVLKDNGTLIVSSPNAIVTQPINGVPRNPFHVHEFYPLELRELLSGYFSKVQLFGQHLKGQIPNHCNIVSEDLKERNTWLNTIPAGLKQGIASWLPEKVWDKVFYTLRGYHPKARAEDIVITREAIEQAYVIIAVCQV